MANNDNTDPYKIVQPLFRLLMLASVSSLLLCAILSVGPDLISLVPHRVALESIVNQEQIAVNQYEEFRALGGPKVLTSHYEEGERKVQAMRRILESLQSRIEELDLRIESIEEETKQLTAAKARATSHREEIELRRKRIESAQSTKRALLAIKEKSVNWADSLGQYRRTIWVLSTKLDRFYKEGVLIGGVWRDLLQSSRSAPNDSVYKLLIAELDTAPKGAVTASVKRDVEATYLDDFWEVFRKTKQGSDFAFPDSSVFSQVAEAQELYLVALAAVEEDDNIHSTIDDVSTKEMLIRRNQVQVLVNKISEKAGSRFKESIETASYLPAKASLTFILLLVPPILAGISHTFLTALVAAHKSVDAAGARDEKGDVPELFLLRIYSSVGKYDRYIGHLDRLIRWGALLLPTFTACASLVLYLYLRDLLPRIVLEQWVWWFSLSAIVVMIYELIYVLITYMNIIQIPRKSATIAAETEKSNPKPSATA